MTITQNGVLKLDDNDKPVMGGTSSSDNATIINASFDPVTRRLLVDNSGGGSGDVVGPASSTDNAIARFDGTTGKLIQNSVVTVADTTGILSGSQGINIAGATSGSVNLRAPSVAGSNTLTFPAGTTDFTATGGASFVLRQSSAGAAITVSQLAASDLSNGTTGSGSVVLATTPTLVTPILGTPTSGTLTNCTGLPISSGVSGLGTGVATALGVDVGTAGSFVVNGGVLGTPSSGTLTNCTGLPSILVANEGTDTTCFPLFATAATGDLGPKTNANLTYNSNTGAFSIGTSAVLTAGTIELGAASDTTIARSAAGQISVEGVQVATLSNTVTLTNKTISQTFEPATDDTYTGENLTGLNAGATIAQWDCVYLNSSSQWVLTDADAASSAGGVMVAMASAAGTAANPLTVILRGIVRNDGWTWATIGAPLYLDTTTAGGMTLTAPSGTDDVVKIVGYVLSDDCIYFNPSNDWITRV